MPDFSVCYVASRAINSIPEGHNLASIGIMRAAVKAGIDVKVVSLENDLMTSREDVYPVKTLLKANRETSYLPPIGEVISSFPAMSKAKNLDCDIIHLLNVTKEVFLLSKRLLRARGLCIPHYFHSSYPFSSYATFRIRSMLLKRGIFEHVFASNRLLLGYLSNELKLSSDSVHLVPYPVDTNRFKPRDKRRLRQKHGVPLDAPVIAFVGAFDADRGFPLLLQAFKEILRATPQAILYVCQPDSRAGLGESTLDRYLGSPRAAEQVVLKGPISFVEEIYSLADVVALPFSKPYWITAPPLVLLEAMASATPVVTTPVDVIKEIGTDMTNMIFAVPGDIASLVESIVYGLANQEEARTIGLNAREYAESNFSLQVVGERLRETYGEICGS